MSRAAGALAVSIALANFLAWTGLALFGAAAPAWVFRMNPVTAVCLMLAGAALWLPRGTRPSVLNGLKLGMGGTIAAIGAAKLAELAIGRGFAVDLALFPEATLLFERSRMAPNTALAFVLLGAGLALSTRPGARAATQAQSFAAGALAVAGMGLISYAYGALSLVEFTSASAMAFQTATCLCAAAVGVLWTRSQRGLTGILTNATLGGTMARRLLPTILLTTVGLGGLRISMARVSLVNEVTGVALLITAILITLVTVSLIFAEGLRRVSLRLAAREHALMKTAAELSNARDEATASARTKADFMANMSHEIRTPLTAIVGYADRLVRRDDLSPVAHRESSRIDVAAQALLAIVNDVLDFSRLEAGQVTIRPTPTDVRQLVSEVLQLFDQQASDKGLALNLTCDATLPPYLLVDPNRTRQILFNLVGNAVKFTEKGAVRAACSYDEGLGRLSLRVEDTGPGVPKAQRELLFRRFFQVDAQSTLRIGGTGLGLFICKGLIDVIVGEIVLSDRAGGGSIFQVAFPAARAGAPAADPPSVGGASLDGARILVVDDEAATRELVRAILAPLGVDVREAADGLEAAATAQGTPFDAILMDLRMPRLDGLAAASRIRRTAGPNSAAPIFAFSATLDTPGTQGVEPVFSGVLRKPFVPADLVSLLSEAATLRSCAAPGPGSSPSA
ncbi:ATP-binding protein [uncultured Phenylobacterium sp.]|uniref:ATP-binding protein n=1 Tax=uncultured Phenylobacterium sp. TaxID=349273 RepID=UPI0025D0FD22|nr:ATP-binding protein [uncultured Phenylobacterium sp.]